MTNPSQPELADLIFSDAATSLRSFEKHEKRASLSLIHRLRSIQLDAAFVSKCAAHFAHLPLVANERCGSWYIDDSTLTELHAKSHASAYFKSTDGHAGQWSFNLRRLNLQLLDVIANGRGAIIVDSTRRGKSMPDALSKTIPIWIAVWNRIVFPDRIDACMLRTPIDVVPASEHDQMETRIDRFVSELKSLGLDLTAISARLQKPMLPIWVTHTTYAHTSLDEEAALLPSGDFFPIVLCTASQHLPSERARELHYVQGAADDSESWAMGLTSGLYWSHKEALLACSEDEIPHLIKQLVQADCMPTKTEMTLIRPTSVLFVGPTISLPDFDTKDIVVEIRPTTIKKGASDDDAVQESDKTRSMSIACLPGKLGSRTLRHDLDLINAFVTTCISSSDADDDPRICISCATGKDHSVGVALAILCLHFDQNGLLIHRTQRERASRPALTKEYIRQRLALIMQSMPDAQPSRSTLQSVNAFLLSREHG